jgi:Tfp pilus assembly protein PilO
MSPANLTREGAVSMNSNNVVLFVLCLVIAGGIAAFWYFTNYQEFAEREQQIQGEINKVSRDIENVSSLEDELRRVKAEYEKTKEQMAYIVKKIKTQQQIPDILRKVEKTAIDNEVKFKDIRISPLVEYEGYSEIPIELGLEAVYNQAGHFLADLENLKIFNVNAGTLSISPKGKLTINPKTNKEEQELNIVLSVKAFVLSKSGEFSAFMN